MPNMKKIFSIKSFLIPLFLSSLFLLGNNIVMAADDISECEPYDASWKISVWKSIDMQSTTENLSKSISNTIFGAAFGKDTNDVVACETQILGKMGAVTSFVGQDDRDVLTNPLNTNNKGLGGGKVCGSTDPEVVAICDELSNTTKTAYYNGKPADLLAIDSSLIGISNRIQNTVLRDPIAVNLAFYFKSQIAKVPFVGKTYAATLGENRMAIINAAFNIWKACRDISLGFMAIILMYTGLMIIMRKKVNQQLVVTIQYAIPKIIIGLILILFSYPIGAAITGLSWGLFRSSTDIVINALYPASAGVSPDVFANNVLLALVIGGLKSGFFSGLGFLLIILVILVALVVLIIVNVKALIIYIKMVFSTVIAPFEFALGTVPGSEDRIKDWFLRMAKYGLTIFAMGLIIPVTFAIAFQVLIYYSFACVPGDCPVEAAGMGSFMAMAVPLLIIIMGLSMATKMEDTVDKLVFGGGKGGKKK